MKKFAHSAAFLQNTAKTAQEDMLAQLLTSVFKNQASSTGENDVENGTKRHSSSSSENNCRENAKTDPRDTAKHDDHDNAHDSDFYKNAQTPLKKERKNGSKNDPKRVKNAPDTVSSYDREGLLRALNGQHDDSGRDNAEAEEDRENFYGCDNNENCKNGQSLQNRSDKNCENRQHCQQIKSCDTCDVKNGTKNGGYDYFAPPPYYMP